MGASVFAYWPGITPRQLKAQPGFGNDCKAWGDFVGELASAPKAYTEIERAGAEALLTFRTQGLDDKDVDWQEPAAVEKAAHVLLPLVRSQDRGLRLALKLYAKNAIGDAPVHEELAQDLDDIAALARWARKAGAKQMTFDINW